MVYTARHFNTKHQIGDVYSISRTQPFELPTLDIFFPPQVLLDDVKMNRIKWGEFQIQYRAYLELRQNEILAMSDIFEKDITLCCWETNAYRCHRYLAASFLKDILNVEIKIR